MQRNFGLIKEKAEKLLADGTVNRVIGWKKGEFFYDNAPAVFNAEAGLESFIYDSFCAGNLSKYLVAESKKEGRILAMLKPCDTYSFNQLVKEHRVNRDKVYILGIECDGMLDINKIKDLGIKGIEKIEEEDGKLLIQTIYGEKICKRSEVLLEKCLSCKGKQHMACDELVTSDGRTSGGTSVRTSGVTSVGMAGDMTVCTKSESTAGSVEEASVINAAEIGAGTASNRFELVEKLEAMTPDERFAFWRGELSKCIRCNACRNVCPACTCVKCVFDNDASGIASKANTDSFEENLFHIIRAFHVAGRCTDCGECSRVCPQNIPLHLLNRKVIKDINEFYGEYQAVADTDSRSPLTDFTRDDVEPGIVMEKGGGVCC